MPPKELMDKWRMIARINKRIGGFTTKLQYEQVPNKKANILHAIEHLTRLKNKILEDL